MKRSILLLALFTALQIVQAQQSAKLIEAKPAMVYSLPKTEILVDVQIEKTVHTPGQYYQYAQRYLATNQIVMEEKSTYVLKSVELRTASVADLSRTYTLPESKYPAFRQLTVNSQGLLCGINTDVVELESTKQKKDINISDKASHDNLLPLGEEHMMAGSSAKLAEGAAKQIYRIRESRMGLLTGDLEHLPDGVSLLTMLEELKEMETKLTELFIGRTETETMTHTVRFVPTESVNKMVLFRVSAMKGLVDNTDLSGVPYFLSLNVHKAVTVLPAGKSRQEKESLNTIIPALTLIVISDGLNNSFVAQDVFMPQLGVIVPLNEEMFKDHNVSVKIDPSTGRLLQILNN